MDILRAAIAILVGIMAHTLITAKRVMSWKAKKENPIPDFAINVTLAEIIAVGAWCLMNLGNYL